MLEPDLLASALEPGAEIYKHDELHQLVAYGDAPVYTTMKKNPDKAMLSRELFEAADHATQLHLVREESMAIAMERSVIPRLIRETLGTDRYSRNIGLSLAREAYAIGLRMTLTTLSKGWFRDFGIEHYPEVKDCDKDLVDLIRADGRLGMDESGQWVKGSPSRDAATSYRLAGPSLAQLKTKLTAAPKEIAFKIGEQVVHPNGLRLGKIVQFATAAGGGLAITVELVQKPPPAQRGGSDSFGASKETPTISQKYQVALRVRKQDGQCFVIEDAATVSKTSGEPESSDAPAENPTPVPPFLAKGATIIGVCAGTGEGVESKGYWVAGCNESAASLVACIQDMEGRRGQVFLQTARLGVVTAVDSARDSSSYTITGGMLAHGHRTGNPIVEDAVAVDRATWAYCDRESSDGENKPVRLPAALAQRASTSAREEMGGAVASVRTVSNSLFLLAASCSLPAVLRCPPCCASFGAAPYPRSPVRVCFAPCRGGQREGGGG